MEFHLVWGQFALVRREIFRIFALVGFVVSGSSRAG